MTIVFFSSDHGDIIQVLEEKSRKPNQRISAKLEAQIKMQYKRRIQNETDMFKCAVYGIIGCCDVPDHAKVAKTTDDFLWIQLSMIQPDDNGHMSTDDSISGDCPTYSGLQSMILEKYGEKYFNANEQPHLYFQVSENQFLIEIVKFVKFINAHLNGKISLGSCIDWTI